jgi:hypothetical protein
MWIFGFYLWFHLEWTMWQKEGAKNGLINGMTALQTSLHGELQKPLLLIVCSLHVLVLCFE